MRTKPKPTSRTKRSPAFVFNNGGTSAPELLRNQQASFTIHISSKLVRNEKMEGRNYLVVPMVMMTVGVHAGSRGPILYNEEELGKTPEVWNHKPVVVYHPKKGDKGVSACTPDVITTHKIGVIMNAEFDALGRLKADAYLEPERVKEVDIRVWNAIKKGEMLELSTGLFCDNENAEGEYEGEKYIAVARNIRADHLAVLPDEVGACSIKDGAGFLRNQLSEQLPDLDPEDLEFVRNRVTAFLARERDEKGVLSKVLRNEASHEQIRDELHQALMKVYPGDEGYASPWITHVFDQEVVYELNGRCFRVDYTKDKDGMVTLGKKPVMVRRQVSYVEVENDCGPDGKKHKKEKEKTPPTKNSVSATTTNNRGTTMNKEQLVADLITNGGFSEKDRSWLMNLDESQLNAMRSATETVTNKAKTATVTPPAPAAAPEAPKPPKAEEVLNSAQLAALRYGERMLTENKAKLVATIKSSKTNRFSDEVLNAMSIEHLEGIAALVPAPTPEPTQNGGGTDFGGLGTSVPVANAAPKAEDALPTPKWEFGSK